MKKKESGSGVHGSRHVMGISPVKLRSPPLAVGNHGIRTEKSNKTDIARSNYVKKK